MDLDKGHKHLIIEIIALALLFISLTFISPVIHETAHIIALKLIKCPYSADWSYSLLKGVSGKIQPLCSFKGLESAIFFSSGYLATLFLGIIPLIISVGDELKSSGRHLTNIVFLIDVVATGLLFSLVISIGSKHDIYLIMEILGLPGFFGTVVNISVALTGGYLGYKLIALDRWKEAS